MPKEISHWMLARKTAESLQGRSLPEALIQAPLNFPAHFYYGAVTPDTAFYCFFGRDKALVSRASGGTHRPESAGKFNASPRLEALGRGHGDGAFNQSIDAFRLGAASHYAADEVFHPLVDELAPTEKEHFRLEMNLDLHYRSIETAPFSPLNVKELFRQLEKTPEACPVGELYNTYINTFLPEPELSRAGTDRVLRLHGLVQGLFFSRLTRRLTSLAAAAAPASYASFPYLFYEREARHYPFFDRLPALEAGTIDRFLIYAGKIADS
jgi:hypothetical protein